MSLKIHLDILNKKQESTKITYFIIYLSSLTRQFPFSILIIQSVTNQESLSNTTSIKVHIFLLDVRTDYNQTSGDYLGSEQLQWLSHKLKTTEADITLIGSGVQVLPMRTSPMEEFRWESKQKLFNVLREAKKSGVILMSGDVHHS